MINPDELGLTVHSITGEEALVTCPYHSDAHPSARFNMSSGLFYCFACGTGKRAEEIAKDLGGTVSDDPVRRPKTFEEPEVDWRSRFMSQPLAIGNEYLESRQVPAVAIKKLCIREYEDGIIFPLFSTPAGDIGGVQVRHYSKTPKYMFYGAKPALYPMTGLPANHAILVEGIFSVIRGRSAGFNVFAVMGAQSLAPALKFFYDRTSVLGIFDPDEAGWTAAAKLASIGIACLKGEFEADEESVEDWKRLAGNRANYTMDVGYFVKRALNAGGKMGTISKQILKFEKENS